MNYELLAPAGSPEILKYVIAAGADAVYVGGNLFGARAYAANFDEEQLLWAIDYVHLHGKKLYLTVNTLLKEKELNGQLFTYLKPFYEAGLDAVLVQDIGVMHFIHENFPDLPIHASTQFTITSKESAMLLKDLGVERAVVSRELSIAEMKEIYEATGMELEAFVHGALCYSYSGMCLFSSLLGGRSGNRGRCAQPCRLSYDVVEEDKTLLKNSYILSLKDLCGIDRLKELNEAGVFSFKIEGRMKQAEYAYGVTRLYADTLKGQNQTNSMQKLSDLGNRGGFTQAYYDKRNDSDMITYRDSSLHKNDALSVPQEISDSLPIEGKASFLLGKPAAFTVSYQNHSFCAEGNPVEAAKNAPSDAASCKERLNKTGNTNFRFQNLELSMDEDVFLPNGALNALRRDALNGLQEEILKTYRRVLIIDEPSFANVPEEKIKNAKPSISASIQSRDQLEPLLESEKIDTIYLPIFIYASAEMKDTLSKDVQRIQAASKEIYLSLPNVLRADGIKIIEKSANWIKDLPIKGFTVFGWDSFALVKRLFPENEIIADFGLYSFNRESIGAIKSMGASLIAAPIELNQKELLHRDNTNGEIVIYGRYPLMQSAGCVCKNVKGCAHKPQVLYLKDRYKALFPVINNCAFCYNTIYNSLPTDLTGQMKELKDMGFSRFRYSFTVESKDEIRIILKDTSALKNQKYTYGHYRRGVE